jgi:hypothetical protein
MKGGESRPDRGDESLRFGPDETVPGWKTPQWSAGRRRASQGTRHRKVPNEDVAPIGAPLPHVCEGDLPSSARGMEMPAHPAPCENRGGGALAPSFTGCWKCESDDGAKAAESVWRSEPEATRSLESAFAEASADTRRERFLPAEAS